MTLNFGVSDRVSFGWMSIRLAGAARLASEKYGSFGKWGLNVPSRLSCRFRAPLIASALSPRRGEKGRSAKL